MLTLSMILIVIILLIFVILVLPYNLQTDEKFLSADDSYDLLRRDLDGYFKSLSITELKKRNTDTINGYINSINTLDFSEEQKYTLSRCINKADKFFLTKFLTNKYGLEIENIPWKLALTQGNAYEFGYPHTRVDTIFISDNIFSKNKEDIVKILIHEKIHLDQKRNPEKYLKIISIMGLTREQHAENITRRANPDIDKYVYYKDGSIYSNSEHPLEEIAYTIDNMYESDK